MSRIPNDATYTSSKLLQYCWAKEYARINADSGIVTSMFDPGQVVTNNDVYHVFAGMLLCCFQPMMWAMGARDCATGAKPAIFLADSAEGAKANGKYVDWGTQGPLKKIDPVDIGVFPVALDSGGGVHEDVLNDEVVKKVWEHTEKMRKELVGKVGV